MPCDTSVWTDTASSEAGAVNDGQPEPESNFWLVLRQHHTQNYSEHHGTPKQSCSPLRKQRAATAYTLETALFPFIQMIVITAPGPFRSFLPCDVVFLRRQLLAPLISRFHDGRGTLGAFRDGRLRHN